LASKRDDWPSFAQFRAQYHAQVRRPNWCAPALSAPLPSKETAMQHIAEMRANLHK